jgi:hypothetical protein
MHLRLPAAGLFLSALLCLLSNPSSADTYFPVLLQMPESGAEIRTPSINNLNDIVWAQRDGAFWQIHKGRIDPVTSTVTGATPITSEASPQTDEA